MKSIIDLKSKKELIVAYLKLNNWALIENFKNYLLLEANKIMRY